MINPRVQVNSVEGDSLLTNWNFSQIWSDLGIEPVGIHAQVMGGISQPDNPGQHSAFHFIPLTEMPDFR
jgi:hypothetical protein